MILVVLWTLTQFVRGVPPSMTLFADRVVILGVMQWPIT
jgi:hypothetical protein